MSHIAHVCTSGAEVCQVAAPPPQWGESQLLEKYLHIFEIKRWLISLIRSTLVHHPYFTNNIQCVRLRHKIPQWGESQLLEKYLLVSEIKRWLISLIRSTLVHRPYFTNNTQCVRWHHITPPTGVNRNFWKNTCLFLKSKGS